MVCSDPWMSFAFLAMMTRRMVDSIEIEFLIANLCRLKIDVGYKYMRVLQMDMTLKMKLLMCVEYKAFVEAN